MPFKSKLSSFLLPIVLLLTVPAIGVIFMDVIFFIIKGASLFNFDSLALMLFLNWIILSPPVLLWSAVRNYTIYNERLEVSYLFGIIKYNYHFNELKLSDYTWSTKGILIETSDGEQMTIGVNQYKNYELLKDELEKRIAKTKLKVNYTNRLTRTWLFIGGISLVLLIIAMKKPF